MQAAFVTGVLLLALYATWGFLRDPTKTMLLDVHCFKIPER